LTVAVQLKVPVESFPGWIRRSGCSSHVNFTP
jgi:hypothetical protein